MNTLVLLSFFVGSCLLLAYTDIKAVTVFLLSLFGYYHFVLFQLIYLAIKQRRSFNLSFLGFAAPNKQPLLSGFFVTIGLLSARQFLVYVL